MYFVVARLAPGKSLFQRSRTHMSAVESTFLDYKLCKALQNPLGKYMTHLIKGYRVRTVGNKKNPTRELWISQGVYTVPLIASRK